MIQVNVQNRREYFEPEFSWDQEISNQPEHKKQELNEPWWYDEK